MSALLFIEEVAALLQRRYGKPVQAGRSNRLWTFGNALTCSVNYSKLLRGQKFFYGLSQEVTDKDFAYPETEFGDFVLLVPFERGARVTGLVHGERFKLPESYVYPTGV